ncbi:MAG: hypothetical protein JW910_06645 [Anaerolineae bacterium]|nr:hypothetical protein [Anaerolineae bacterium]
MKRTVLVVVVLVLALSAALVYAATELIQDGGFELGTPNPYWGEYSSNGYDLIYAFIPYSGTYHAWLGGAGGSGETSILTQDITVPETGEVQVSLMLWLAAYDVGGTDYMEVNFDGTNYAYIAEDAAAYTADYASLTVNFGEYAAGTYTLEFYAIDNSGGGSSFFIDDVSVMFTATGGEEPTEEPEEEAAPVYEQWDPGDARINPSPAMEVAIYCVADGIDLWGFGNAHFGYVSLAEFAAAPATDDAPFFTSADGTVRVYHLANDWWGVQKDQVRGDAVETYQFAWDTCAPTMTETTVYDAAGNLLVYEVGP